MVKHMPKVFIVVLNWNGYKDTIQCLESIEKLQAPNTKIQVVIVDNASVDGSVAEFNKRYIRNTKYKILVNKVNQGFAGGNNIGIKYALKHGADFIMILNNDTIVDKNSVTQFLKSAEKNKEIGIFSPKIYFAPGFEYHKKRYKHTDQGKVIWYAGGKIDWANVYGSNNGVDEVDNGRFEEEREIDFATGACMFVRSQVFKKIGGFDERYFAYLEDADLSLRTRKSGYKILFVPKAIVWHKVSRSSGIGSDLNDYFITRNRLLFGIKYAPIRAKLALIKESLLFAQIGRPWQIKGVTDFYLRKFGKGSWK